MEYFINITITTTVTSLIILTVKGLLKNKISPKWQFALWAIIAVRLLMPILPESDLSIFNSVPQVEYKEPESSGYSNYIEESILEIATNDVQNNNTNENETIVIRKADKEFSISKMLIDNTFTIWVTGSIALLLYIITIYVIHNVKTKKYNIVKNPEILSVLDDCKSRLGIHTHIIVREGGETPLLKGLLRPEIILPRGYTKNELTSVFTHELAHLKHKDVLWNIIGALLLCAYWYNPVVWYCFFAYKRDMEILCDYRVLEVYDNRKAYASVLLKTALNKNKFILATTSMQNGKKDISKRIKYIAYFRKPRVLWSSIAVIVAVIIAAMCLTNPIGKADDELVVLDYERIYEYKTQYVGDANKVSNLLNNLYYAEYKDGISLKTEARPYGVTINYRIDSIYDDFMHNDLVMPTDKMAKNSAMMFCLIDNVDKISIALHNDGIIYTFHITRESIYNAFGEDIRSYSSSFDEFKNEFIPLLEKQNWSNGNFGVYIQNKVELYVWRNKDITGTDDVYYTILQGTNKTKRDSEIYNLDIATNQLELVNERLSQYQGDFHLSIKHDNSMTKEEMYKLDESIIFNGNIRTIGVFGEVLDKESSNNKVFAVADKVEDLLQIIMSSPLYSSAPGDYIKNHQTEYETIIKMGDDALEYMLSLFEKGEYDGLKGHIMMLACIDILGDRNNVEEDTYYSPKEWYSKLSPYQAVSLTPFKISAMDNIERLVYTAALSQYSDNNEDSVTIVAPRIFGSYEIDNELRIFTTVYYSEYKLYGTNLSQNSAGVVPAAIIYTKNDNGSYEFKEYVEARDGAYFKSSIEEFCHPRDDIAEEIMTHYGDYSDIIMLMQDNLIYYLEENDMKGIGLKKHDGSIIPLT